MKVGLGLAVASFASLLWCGFAFYSAPSGSDAELRSWLFHDGAGVGAIQYLHDRLVYDTVLTVLGVLGFWFGVLVVDSMRSERRRLTGQAHVKGISIGLGLMAFGLLLPCFPVKAIEGVIFSLPPNAIGLGAMLLSALGSRKRQAVRQLA